MPAGVLQQCAVAATHSSAHVVVWGGAWAFRAARPEESSLPGGSLRLLASSLQHQLCLAVVPFHDYSDIL